MIYFNEVEVHLVCRANSQALQRNYLKATKRLKRTRPVGLNTSERLSGINLCGDMRGP